MLRISSLGQGGNLSPAHAPFTAVYSTGCRSRCASGPVVCAVRRRGRGSARVYARCGTTKCSSIPTRGATISEICSLGSGRDQPLHPDWNCGSKPVLSSSHCV
uniref:Uncharacterized protein n=1 Tax=Cacopsylla melanoneura TaxID=428564 RepID=A0A8D8S127_9HEMI